VAIRGDGTSILRYCDTIPLAGMSGEVADLAMYAGQGVGLCSRRQPAREIVAELTAQTLSQLEVLTRLAGLGVSGIGNE
jgi:hypothetical protein